MSFYIEELLKDECSLTIEDLRDKYQGIIPRETSIKESVAYIISYNLQDLVIDHIWHGDSRDKKVHFCLKEDDRYEVFASERKTKAWLETFDNFEDAAFSKLDLLFNELNYCAPDSKINFK